MNFYSKEIIFIHFRYSPTGLPIKPRCKHNKKQIFQCLNLTSNDIFNFHSNFYHSKKKTDQDNYILQYCKTISPKRKRPKDNTRTKKLMSVQYFIRKHKSREKVQVCRQAFLDILRIKPSRLKGVLTRNWQSGCVAQEKRGGDRKEFEFRARKEAVIKFIQKFEPLELHHIRGKIKHRIYLDASLNITKMFKMYNDQSGPGMSVTHSFFRKVFNRNFNIGFGTPRKDVCSTCLQLQEQIKHEKCTAKKQKLMIDLRIHKLRAKAFFEKLREERDDLITVSFDCQKNLPLPKVPDQSTYYSRQLYLYNFTVVIGSSHSKLQQENVKAYVWTEDVTSKSANEICSALLHCLNSINIENINTVRLMADGCGGQNKNSFLISMASKWLQEAPLSLKTVEIIFPVTGHSFLPADRVFALTEMQIRKLETIVEPIEYINLIGTHATVHKLGSEVPVFDFRAAVGEVVKPTNKWHFQITKIKRVILRRGKRTHNVMARGEISYKSDTGVSKPILRPTKTFAQMNPEEVKLGIVVSELKLTDVQKLLNKHYGSDWEKLELLQFYKNVLARDHRYLDIRENDECHENEIEEILDFV